MWASSPGTPHGRDSHACGTCSVCSLCVQQAGVWVCWPQLLLGPFSAQCRDRPCACCVHELCTVCVPVRWWMKQPVGQRHSALTRGACAEYAAGLHVTSKCVRVHVVCILCVCSCCMCTLYVHVCDHTVHKVMCVSILCTPLCIHVCMLCVCKFYVCFLCVHVACAHGHVRSVMHAMCVQMCVHGVCVHTACASVCACWGWVHTVADPLRSRVVSGGGEGKGFQVQCVCSLLSLVAQHRQAQGENCL